MHQRIGPGGLEIGCWVAQAAARRRIALTTASMLVEVALSAPGIDRVEWHHAVENRRSEGVARTLGMRRVATELQEPLAPGLGGEVAIWRITRHEATEDARGRWADQRIKPGSPPPAGTPAPEH